MCKVVPRAYALIAIMICALLVQLSCSNDVNYSAGQMCGIGGCTYLVAHDIDLRSCSCEAEHCLEEVFTIGAIEPRGANDNMIAPAAQYGLFACQLCTTIYTGGVCRMLFVVGGVVSIATKDIVGRDVYEYCADLRSNGSQIFDCHVIE